MTEKSGRTQKVSLNLAYRWYVDRWSVQLGIKKSQFLVIVFLFLFFRKCKQYVDYSTKHTGDGKQTANDKGHIVVSR